MHDDTKINTEHVITDIEKYLIQSFDRSRAHTGNLLRKTEDVDGWNTVLSYLDKLQNAVQDVTEESLK